MAPIIPIGYTRSAPAADTTGRPERRLRRAMLKVCDHSP